MEIFQRHGRSAERFLLRHSRFSSPFSLFGSRELIRSFVFLVLVRKDRIFLRFSFFSSFSLYLLELLQRARLGSGRKRGRERDLAWVRLRQSNFVRMNGACPPFCYLMSKMPSYHVLQNLTVVVIVRERQIAFDFNPRRCFELDLHRICFG